MPRETTLERILRHVRETAEQYPGTPYLIRDTPRNRKCAQQIHAYWHIQRGHICIEAGAQ